MQLSTKLFLCLFFSLLSFFFSTIPSHTQAPPPSIQFSATPNTIPSGSPTILSWTTKKADNTIIDPGNIIVSVNGSIQVFPTSTTTYTMTATGSTGTSTANVTVNVSQMNTAPAAENDFASTDEDSSILLTPLENDIDSDGDSLISIESFSQPSNGTVIDNEDGTLTFSPQENFNGSITLDYTINDGNGGTDSATISIMVNPVNDPPIAAPQSLTTTQNTQKQITLYADDIDGDPLLYNIINTRKVVFKPCSFGRS